MKDEKLMDSAGCTEPRHRLPVADVELSVVIPVYRSKQTIGLLLNRLLGVLECWGRPHEIILVDDGSPDDTWEALAAAHRTYPDRVIAVQLMRNFGQHNALMCGLRLARGRYVVTMDDDLQHPPEEVPELVHVIETRGDALVYGVPRCKQHSVFRNITSALCTAFFRLVFHTRAQISAFRAIRRELVQTVVGYPLNYTFLDGLLAWNTQRIGQVSVEHHKRRTGRSGYSLGRLLVLAVNLFTNFSLLPLHLVSLIGMVAAMGGFALGTYYLVRYLLASITVPGYASTIIAILVLGGAQLLSIGTLGQYLGRMHLNINRKPQYSIRRVACSEPGGQGDSAPPEGSWGSCPDTASETPRLTIANIASSHSSSRRPDVKHSS